ncbi:polysaccharide deacetylase family protein [Alcanivorax sp. S71-1-4]|uniref:polysaccharide deacetylase family protein n=1 Tax=Alcanivorax sp. S71-1-4 TaxID=1177159 RepID=UPI001357AD0D|nr:polysaccharide deacetylase family protein [Alcanivorax sp. S71-1-4]
MNRSSGKAAMFILFLTLAALASPARAAVILLYHHVAEDTPASTSVTPAMFETHLRHLREEGFEVVRLDELVRRVRAGEPAETKLAAITFDDAYRSIHDNAMPLLARHGWPASVFVSTGAVGEGGNMMNVAQLQALQEAGHLLLNHSHRHAHLVRRQDGESARAWAQRVRADIEQAQALLSDWLGEPPPRYVAYPYGEQDEAVRALLRDLDYLGFAQRSGAVDADTDWQNIPRIPVNRHYADWDSLGDKVRALPMPVRDVSPAGGVTTEKRPVLTMRLPASWADRNVNCFAGGAAVVERATVQDGVQLRVTPGRDLTPGRTLVNCTASAGQGRFYWYSWLWMHHDGEWYRE